MVRTLLFGKVDYYEKNRRNCAVEVKIKLENKSKDGKSVKCFSVIADVWNAIHSDICMGMAGEGLNTIKSLVEQDTPYGAEFAEIARLGETYHLNEMHAGTPEQEKAIKEAGITDYRECCEYLKNIGLYEVTLPDGSPYKYGHRWLTKEIPEADLKEIEDILKRGLVAIRDYLPDKEQEILEQEAFEEEDMER